MDLKRSNAPESKTPPSKLTRRRMLLGAVTAAAALAPMPVSQAHAQLVFDTTSRTLEPDSDRPIESRFRISNPSQQAITLISVKAITPGTRARFSSGSKTIRPGEGREVIVTTPGDAGRQPKVYRVEVRTDQRVNPITTLTVTIAQPDALKRQQRLEAARAKRKALMAGLTLTPNQLVWSKGEAASTKTVTIEAAPGHAPDLAIEVWATPMAVHQARAERLARKLKNQPINPARSSQASQRLMGLTPLYAPEAFKLELSPAQPSSGNRRWTLQVTPKSTDEPGRAMLRLAAFPDGLPAKPAPTTQPDSTSLPTPAQATTTRYQEAVGLVIPARIKSEDRPARPNAAPTAQTGN